MSLHVRRIAATAISALAAALPLSSHADITLADGAPPSTAAAVALPQTQTSLLAYAVDQQRAFEMSGMRSSPFGLPPSFSFVPSDAALGNPLSESLRGDSDVFLWNYVGMLHALKAADGFDLNDTRVAVVVAMPPVSPVPLPTMTWLLVVTVLGLFGAARMGRASNGVTAPDEAPGLPGHAVPA